jgi:hypothetical protein
MIDRFDDRQAIARILPATGAERFGQIVARAASAWRRVEKVIVEHPKQSLIAALAAGAVLGWITKRR